MCKHAVKNFSFMTRYISDRYRTREMCNKSVNTSLSAIKFIPECCKPQEMCVKAVYTCPFIFDSVPDWYKTQGMCDKAVSNDPFMVKYCVDRYKTQEMCNKAVNDFLPALKFIPDWFVTSKLSKSLDDALFSSDDILFFDEDCNSVTSFGGEIGILSVDLDRINLDDVNFHEDDPETIIQDTPMAWPNRFKQDKLCQ